MIATIDGLMVNGTPEEIHRFRELNVKSKTSTDMFFKCGAVTTTVDINEIAKKLDHKLKIEARRGATI
ncbi:hypothetical protein [Mesobacillus zeae]|uniref:Uncharacterized protein n=1 Tax=Mesobacillus zeae TaxID=1917180 RepID=A0A398B853_9BACI|nr:hypothetical protein [Mesobacillus zeae]RID85664.1 hypothetical protein D1970_08910 [Mesobacillus zeae]